VTRASAPLASAPGKCVLVGEYAVLDGYEAVVAAVDVRARVYVEAGSLTLEGNTSGPIARADATAQLPLLSAVLDEIERSGTRPAPAHYRVDTSAFARAGKKVGLGSSAAACVAFTRAVLAHSGRGAHVDEVFQLARAAHRAFQGGGSGIDIAASAYGGLVRFTREGAPKRGLALPRGISLVVVFTGASTSTQGFVDRFLALPDRAAHAAALGGAAAGFVAACEAGEARDAVAAIHGAREAMAHMGRTAGIDVVSDAHARIAALAEAHGGSAKPSGAGGGDIAVAFVPDDARAPFVAAVAAAGFTHVVAQIDPVGVAP
jgi:phosphomevalonate kinase